MIRVVGVVATLVAIAGCSAAQLRHKTGRQVRTLADIYQQQVLDNLARFASDQESLPFFAYASQGTTTFSDQMALSLTGVVQYQTQEAWQLTPVNDPRKLELMRCIYQRVIAVHCRRALRADCPNCERLFRNFYTGDPDVRVDQHDHKGIVTIDCLDATNWLAIGCAKCLPEIHGSAVGRHGEVRVWILPGGSDELSKLTLAILDYALHDPPAKGSKTVTFHLTKQGELTTAGNSFADVSGQIAADAGTDSLATLPYITALEHICGRNDYGLTVDALRDVDPEAAGADHHAELRNRYHLTQQEWEEICRLLARIREHQIDSPIERLPGRSAERHEAGHEEPAVLPAPLPELATPADE
ncbi:MAG TPA: hypothetical protein VHC22_03030 [Pirellulales bacterium]|nr:hypothetical protein [Pirellulales bacterium]